MRPPAMPNVNPQGRRLVLGLLALAAWIALPAEGAAPRSRASGRQVADAVGIRGGLCVQVGAADTAIAADLAATGRFLVHVLDTDPNVVAEARRRLARRGAYGLVSADRFDWRGPLPYAEDLVNLLIVLDAPAPGRAPREILRVLRPGGVLLAATDAFAKADVQAAGLTDVREIEAGGRWFTGVKGWPKVLGQWTHPRHSASGNAVSTDTAVGPPARIRWVVGASAEVPGMVSAGGRNFYAGVLARDAFNGLRLWARDLEAPGAPAPAAVKGLRRGVPSPVTDGRHVFAVIAEGGKHVLAAFDAAGGQIVRRYPAAGSPRAILHDEGTLIVADEGAVRGVRASDGRLLWTHTATDPRYVVAGDDVVALLEGQARRGEQVRVLALSKASGAVRWQREDLPWSTGVRRCVYYRGVLAYEISTLNDDGPGNALYMLSAADGAELWGRNVFPGMNHMRQLRPMFIGDRLWLLEGGKTYTGAQRRQWEQWKKQQAAAGKKGKGGSTGTKTAAPKAPKSVPIMAVARDIRSGEELDRLKAGLTHCFPPVATVRYMLAGEMDLTELVTGKVQANQITKAACGRDSGWVPANGLIYVTPKHCVCWPMLRGYAALAPARKESSDADKPVGEIRFVLERGVRAPDSPQAAPADGDWPCYRHDAWRSGSTTAAGPASLKLLWSADLRGQAPPAGPITDDWREDPFVKGPVTAPVAAGGLVYVARPDAHEVVALDAADGSVRWRRTVNGRVDTPPTVHDGTCLFGTSSGWVYCLRGDDGRMVWRLRAAPLDERIVAYGQLESPWPVAGSVLVVDGVVYFAAGRQSLAEGGILVFAVAPASGRARWVRRLNTVPQKGFYRCSGLEFDNIDLLQREADGVAMSRWVFARADGAMHIEPWNAFAKLNTGKGETWVPRGCWSYAPRNQARVRGFSPLRPLTVFRDGVLLGCTEDKRSVYRRDFDAASVKSFNPRWITGWAASEASRKGGLVWRSQRLAEGARWKKAIFPAKPAGPTIRAMALAGDRLYTVGSDGQVMIVAAADGKVIAQASAQPPVWDGAAVSRGRLLLCTQAGRVLCLGSP